MRLMKIIEFLEWTPLFLFNICFKIQGVLYMISTLILILFLIFSLINKEKVKNILSKFYIILNILSIILFVLMSFEYYKILILIIPFSINAIFAYIFMKKDFQKEE